MQISMKAIGRSTDLFDVAALEAGLTKALDDFARDKLQPDFQKTVAAWSGPPSIEVVADTTYQRTVSITDQKYTWVNEGTPPHVITPRSAKRLFFRTPYNPSTRPGVIGSSGAATGSNQVFSQEVHHPGTKARKFDQAIVKKWESKFPGEIQKVLAKLQK